MTARSAPSSYAKLKRMWLRLSDELVPFDWLLLQEQEGQERQVRCDSQRQGEAELPVPLWSNLYWVQAGEAGEHRNVVGEGGQQHGDLGAEQDCYRPQRRGRTTIERERGVYQEDHRDHVYAGQPAQS